MVKLDVIFEVVITAPDVEWLSELVRKLVEERLVASGKVVSGVWSVHRGQGEIVERPEAMALLHTQRTLVERIVERVKAEHPDEVPGIRVADLRATRDYARWVNDSTW